MSVDLLEPTPLAETSNQQPVEFELPVIVEVLGVVALSLSLSFPLCALENIQ